MGMTMTQKILAAHAGLDHVEAGQLIMVDLDLVLANDITGPVAIHEVEKLKKKTVFDKDKVALVPDHFAPNKDIKSAEHCKCVREYAKEHEITNYFEVGEMGIEHALLPEKGLIVAGETCIGADSHTCTYGALGAFSTGVGSTDMGCGMITGQAWFKVPSAIKVELTGKLKPWVSGKDVILHLIGQIGVDGALYRSKIDQVVIGSCTNGRIEDMRTAAEILKGRKVKKGIRCIVIPATQDVYLQCIEEGLTQIFIKAGAIVSTPTCGPCLGGYMGILAAGERAISTTNRNFVGRMGHVDSEVYLASPAVAAASAVTGKISEPAELGVL